SRSWQGLSRPPRLWLLSALTLGVAGTSPATTVGSDSKRSKFALVTSTREPVSHASRLDHPCQTSVLGRTLPRPSPRRQGSFSHQDQNLFFEPRHGEGALRSFWIG